MTDKKARSPYQRHSKQPYLYSQELRNWREAVRRRDMTEADRANAVWHRRHGVDLGGRRYHEAAE